MKRLEEDWTNAPFRCEWWVCDHYVLFIDIVMDGLSLRINFP